MSQIQPIKRPQSLTELATRQLRQAIANGELGLGEPISESQLAERLGISKTPVREALALLRVEGLVTIVPQKGTFVFTLSAKEVIELCELRVTLEAAALRLAVERDPAALHAALSGVVDGMGEARAAGDVRAYLRLDTAFHEQFFRHCRNGYMADVYGMLVGKIAALRTHLAARPSHTRKSYAEHQAIAAAVGAGDLAGALAILDRHIARTKRTYAETIDDIAEADRRTGLARLA